MKDIILKLGETLLSLFVVLGLIIAIFVAFSNGFQGIIIGLVIIICIVMTTFLLYLVIDIRDKSIEMNKLLSKIADNQKNNDLIKDK